MTGTEMYVLTPTDAKRLDETIQSLKLYDPKGPDLVAQIEALSILQTRPNLPTKATLDDALRLAGEVAGRYKDISLPVGTD